MNPFLCAGKEGPKFFDLKKRNLSVKEIEIGKKSAAYVFEASGLNYRDGGIFTESEGLNAFGEYFPEVLKIMKAEGMIVVVEREPLSELRYGGTRKDLLTYNPWKGIHSELLAHGNSPGSTKESSPRARIVALQKIIADSLTDVEELKEEEKNLELSAGHIYDTILSVGSEKDPEIGALMRAGGFDVVPRRLKPLRENIARIEKAKEVVAGYDCSVLDLVLEVKPEELSGKFYRGKPPITQKQKKPKEGELGWIGDIYSETIIPSPLKRQDVEKYLKEWMDLQKK